jgi:hypothetical protein
VTARKGERKKHRLIEVVKANRRSRLVAEDVQSLEGQLPESRVLKCRCGKTLADNDPCPNPIGRICERQ